jgi:phage shock protein A
MAFAELDMGKALGDLPYKTALKIARAGKSVVARKLDIGAGGGPIAGLPRKIDLWYQTAEALGLPDVWSGAVRIEDAAADGDVGSHDLPKQETGSYTKHKAGASDPKTGGTYGSPVKGHYKVRTEKLSISGTLPDNLDACNKELRQRQRELGEYRAAIRKTKDPEAKQAYEVNVRQLEARISALKKQRLKLLRQAATAKAVKKISEAASFLHWTAPNTGLFARLETANNEAQERAEQAVTLEPEEPTGGVTGDWVKSVLESYVANTESPAYARVLGVEGDWRNSILGAENFAGKRVGEWRGQITKLHETIEEIEALRKSHPQAYAKRKGLIPGMQQQMRALRESIKKTRTETVPEWEDSLGGIQGLGRSHEILDALPGVPTGDFGGNIFDTQMAIKGLGLKVPQAMANLSDSDTGKGDREALLEELLRQANQRNILRGIEEHVFGSMAKPGGLQLGGLVKVMPPYAGMAHTGAIVPGPPTQEKTMIVRGGEGIFTEGQMAAMGGAVTSGPPIIEEMHVYPDGVKMHYEGQEFETAVRKVTSHDNHRGARGASRGLAPAGVFGR